MKLNILTPNVTVLAQPTVEEIRELAERGYRSIIGNRPEGEAPDQPAWIELKAAAARYGMEAVEIPVVANAISVEDVEQFRAALERLPKPIAAFCRTGTRSALLWALANEAGLTADERIRIAATEGCNLEPFRSVIEGGVDA